ncbi:hypothetical protein K788_0000928 [Paraburkholderia caribensis MBA4]|uniref:Uncharacterized protein n=1 Tax=Paraburkholderia caribensis MBA4 TaxID=1323664 RepID=A0A0P0RH99_9BURK|nr:hypothetical protein K788_0000928 [Paraburkholderia caribensis MBA4]
MPLRPKVSSTIRALAEVAQLAVIERQKMRMVKTSTRVFMRGGSLRKYTHRIA